MKIIMQLSEIKTFLNWLYGFDEKSLSRGYFPKYDIKCDSEKNIVAILIGGE